MIRFSRPFTGVTPVCIAATNPLNWHSRLWPDFSHSLGLERLPGEVFLAAAIVRNRP
jgi:hypothetical protein